MTGNETGRRKRPFVNATPKGHPMSDTIDTLPGLQLTHLITVSAAAILPAAQSILEEIAASGAALKSLSLNDAGIQRLSVAGLAVADARALAERLAALPGIAQAQVEHHLARCPL